VAQRSCQGAIISVGYFSALVERPEAVRATAVILRLAYSAIGKFAV
jgi:hypothetical protein